MNNSIGFGNLDEGVMEFIDDPFAPGIETGAGLQNRADATENNEVDVDFSNSYARIHTLTDIMICLGP